MWLPNKNHTSAPAPSSSQLHRGQPDESGHHALHRDPRRSHHPPQPLPQLPAALGQHARLQPGEHVHHRPRHGPPAADPGGAAGGREGGAARPEPSAGWGLQRECRRRRGGQTGQEDKKRTDRLMLGHSGGRNSEFLSHFFSGRLPPQDILFLINITDPLVLQYAGEIVVLRGFNQRRTRYTSLWNLENWTKYEQMQTEWAASTRTRCRGTGSSVLNLFCRCHLVSASSERQVVCLVQDSWTVIKATVVLPGNTVTLDYLFAYTVIVLRNLILVPDCFSTWCLYLESFPENCAFIFVFLSLLVFFMLLLHHMFKPAACSPIPLPNKFTSSWWCQSQM